MSSVGPGPVHPSAADAQRVISLIDLTDLNDEHDPVGLRDLVDRALEHGVPAVCVWPEFVGTVVAALDAEPERGTCSIATVVNFPGGDDPIADVSSTTRDALAAGADEIDLVLPYVALRGGDPEAPRAMVQAIAQIVHAHTGRGDRRAELKVILETGELGSVDLVTWAAQLAIDAGADFIKTSTGKTAVSATLDAFAPMVDAVAQADRTIGLKPSGGIRTVAEAIEYLAVVDSRLGADWATPATFRFGASSLLDDAIAVALTA
ncbi:deoxyribose-phosphate aldolase [Ilumatobacter nonamiensis]|uniref:deoxyribose-phosphate aldolase n=1 Tax=Ilumatobacter nonamiensis TaxID=467093 RepID=UPI00058B3887|nr:deoxyribose-phosphate aldolase [Ilumatobacter nonamiensis]